MAISEGEARFERIRRTAGRIAAPAVLTALLVAPLPLPREAHVMAAVAAFTVILWITEAIPLWAAALLGPAVAVALGAATPLQAALPFVDDLLLLFLGGFLLAEAVSVRGFDRRAALFLLSRRFIAGSPARAMTAVACLTFAFSMWVSNTATAAMMIPIAVGLCDSIRRSLGPEGEAKEGPLRERIRRYDEGMLLTLAYAASLGGLSTPIGTGPNIIAIGELERIGVHVDFLRWMAFALPVALALLLCMLFAARLRFPPPREKVLGMSQYVEGELAGLGTMGSGERRAVAVFGVAVAGWIGPPLVQLALGKLPFVVRMVELLTVSNVAIACALLVLCLPAGKTPRYEPVLPLRRAVKIDWGTLVLLGGGLSLGTLVFESGLATALGRSLLAIAPPGPGFAFALLALSVLAVLCITELTSNTAAINMMLPVVIPLAIAAGVDPVPLTLAATMAASLAFMLPVSTPPNAIAYGTGRVRIGAMLRFGLLMDLAGLALLLFAGRWFIPLFGFGPTP